MPSLLMTEPSDFLIGSSYGKHLERDSKNPVDPAVVPDLRRHYYYWFPIFGDQGAIGALVQILDKIFDETGRPEHHPGQNRHQLRAHPIARTPPHPVPLLQGEREGPATRGG